MKLSRVYQLSMEVTVTSADDADESEVVEVARAAAVRVLRRNLAAEVDKMDIRELTEYSQPA